MTPPISQKVCCSTARDWCTLIAWLQIIIHITCTVLVVIGVIILSVVPDTLSHYTQMGVLGNEAMMSILVFTQLFVIFGIVFGTLLLKGANERNPTYLRIWIIFACVSLCWSIVSTLCYVHQEVLFSVLQLILACILYGFSIWVVNIAKNEFQLNNLQNGRAYTEHRQPEGSDPPKYSEQLLPTNMNIVVV